MTSIHHFFHSETAKTFNKAKGFCWLFVSAHLCVCVCVYLFVPPISASPSKSPLILLLLLLLPISPCVSGWWLRQPASALRCSSFTPPLSLSLFSFSFSLTLSLSSRFTSIGWGKGHVSAYILSEVWREVVLWSDVNSFCCMLRIQCSFHTP